MANLQWVVGRRYGTIQSIPANISAALPLFTMPDYSSVDPHALEEAPQEDFQVLRIVGHIWMRGATDGGGAPVLYTWGWRLLNLSLDLSTGGFDTPWPAGAPIMNDVDVSNEPRWWAERYYQSQQDTGIFDGLGVIDNPWWTMVDIKPNALCGPGQGDHDYPALVIDNTENPFILDVFHRLRILIEVQGRR